MGFMNPPLEEKGGQWTERESEEHINVLELRSVRFGIQACYHGEENVHIRIFSDNTATVSSVNHQGSVRSLSCDQEAQKIWKWAEKRNCWLSAAHVAGVKNVTADEKSRKFNQDSEWSLNQEIFGILCQEFGKPDIDLFASRLNHKVKIFCSWEPEPGAAHVDALMLDWKLYNYPYIFCPFSLIPNVLQLLDKHQSTALVIVPYWPTQNWFSTLTDMIISVPVVIPVKEKTLSLIHKKSAVHPLVGKLKLIAVTLSGKLSEREAFLDQYQRLWKEPGGQELKNSTRYISQSGLSIAVRGVSVQLKLLCLRL